MMRSLLTRFAGAALCAWCAASVEAAAATNALPTLASSGSSAAASVFRMIGALCLVFALFFGAAWVFRNWARLNPGRAGQRRLHVLEGKSLGGRQSVFVVAYENQRFLIGSTPQGMTLLSQLPELEDAPNTPATIVPLPFSEALMQALGRK